MAWFRREQEEVPKPAAPGSDPADRPEALLAKLIELIRFINASSGRLPGEAVVISRRITDTIREVIATADERELDIYAVVSLRGVMDDYLPTTLRSYLALDPTLASVPRSSGRTPNQSLREQLDELWSAVADVLAATHAQDADALLSQGSFLRTKFTQSDLDL